MKIRLSGSTLHDLVFIFCSVERFPKGRELYDKLSSAHDNARYGFQIFRYSSNIELTSVELLQITKELKKEMKNASTYGMKERYLEAIEEIDEKVTKDTRLQRRGMIIMGLTLLIITVTYLGVVLLSIEYLGFPWYLLPMIISGLVLGFGGVNFAIKITRSKSEDGQKANENK